MGATEVMGTASFDVLFQSTLPRGERPGLLPGEEVKYEISIHAPARGATEAKGKSKEKKRISIHAPARGATDIIHMGGSYYTNFNPRSREGSDIPEDSDIKSVIIISIHAPARGATI